MHQKASSYWSGSSLFELQCSSGSWHMCGFSETETGHCPGDFPAWHCPSTLTSSLKV